MLNYLFQDWPSNRGNIKAQLVLIFFRFCHFTSTKNRVLLVLSSPFLIVYRILVEWVLGIEIPFRTKIGKCLILYHGQSLIINNKTIIGANCTLRQSTTIGNKQFGDNSWSGCPFIGDNVDIGCNVVIIGPITIGDNVTIGAGSIVTKNIPANVTIAGNPARIIKHKTYCSPYSYRG